jgi:F-type H+-transporting ATPase subunit epsilon
MKLELVTLTGEKLSEEVYEVTIPTLDGEISVFPGHETLVSVATEGVLYVRRKKSDSDDTREVYALSGGVIQVSPTLVRILVDEAETADDIALGEAEAALERAKDLKANAKGEVSITEAEAMMNRAAARLKVANLRRRR